VWCHVCVGSVSPCHNLVRQRHAFRHRLLDQGCSASRCPIKIIVENCVIGEESVKDMILARGEVRLEYMYYVIVYGKCL
jgi:hypothetical protein